MPEYIHEAILGAYLQDAASRNLDEAVSAAYMAPWTSPDGQPAFYRQIAQMDQRFTDEVQTRYGEIDLPVLIVWGEQDRWIPIEKGRELHTMISNSEFSPVPGAGHLVQEDMPGVVQTTLGAFLSRNYVAG